MAAMESHRDIMQGVADTQAASTSHVMSEEKFDAVVHHLMKHPDEKSDPHLKHWVKTKQYQLMDLPGLGLNKVLVIPNKSKVKVFFLFMIVH